MPLTHYSHLSYNPSNSITNATTIPKLSLPKMNVFIVDRKTTQPLISAKSTSTISSTSTLANNIPRVRLVVYPPHPDWYKFKPVPRAPLPLYHPNRVFRQPKPIITSKALPLTRRRIEDPPVNNGPRSSARNRRLPVKLREGDAAPGSPSSSTGDRDLNGADDIPEKKQRRARRKKSEMIAAAADGEVTVAPRRKRKRAGVEDEEPAAANSNVGMDESPLKKRRKKRGAPASGDEAGNQVVSSYGTRSRTAKREASGTNSDTLSVDEGVEETEDVTPQPRKQRVSKRVASPQTPTQTPTLKAKDIDVPMVDITCPSPIDITSTISASVPPAPASPPMTASESASSSALAVDQESKPIS